MALGAIAAIKEAGKEIKSGEMAMTVYQSAKGQAESSVQAAINMLEGKDLAADTECEVSSESSYVLYFPFESITADNLDSIK